MDVPFSWSASRHDTFASCRRRYYYSYYAAPEDPEIQRLKRLSALGYLSAHPTVETVRLLRDYIAWERQPMLRRRAEALVRRPEPGS